MLPEEEHATAVRQAYSLAKGERLAELHGRAYKRWDARGLHAFSMEIGRIQALRDLCPELRDIPFDPVLLRKQAQEEAAVIYEREVALDVGVRMGWISPEQAQAITNGGTKCPPKQEQVPEAVRSPH